MPDAKRRELPASAVSTAPAVAAALPGRFPRNTRSTAPARTGCAGSSGCTMSSSRVSASASTLRQGTAAGAARQQTAIRTSIPTAAAYLGMTHPVWNGPSLPGKYDAFPFLRTTAQQSYTGNLAYARGPTGPACSTSSTIANTALRAGGRSTSRRSTSRGIAATGASWRSNRTGTCSRNPGATPLCWAPGRCRGPLNTQAPCSHAVRDLRSAQSRPRNGRTIRPER
jgi:hypothetical protein